MAKRARVASASDIPPNAMKTVEVEGKEILVVNVEGQFHAMGAICTHSEWDLSEGILDATRVTCAGHGSIWDLKSGEAEFVRPLPPLPVYRTEVEGDGVYVEL